MDEPPKRRRGRPRRVLRTLSFPLVALAALVLWFEEWLWGPTVRAMHWVGGLPILRVFEALMRGAPPYVALLFFLMPMLAIFPFKLAGLWLIAREHLLSGLCMFIGAKLVGTALMAWILSCTKPALMRLTWFAFCWDRFMRAKHWLYGRVRQQAAWVWTKRKLRQARLWFKRWF